MKQIYMIFVVSMSFAGLNAMSNAPDVTKWQEICKDPQEKQKLITVYQNFCQKRFRNAIPLTIAVWASCVSILTSPRTSTTASFVTLLFTGVLTFPLAHRIACKDSANQGNLYYLNRDVLKRLGNPEVRENRIYPLNSPYHKGYELKNVDDIERALSGKHPE